MNLSELREHLKFLVKAFFFYRRGFEYVWMRFVVAPRIFRRSAPLEKKQTRDDFSMHMFVGKRDFLMGMWSLASFYRYTRVVGSLVIHSDGSLEEKERAVISRLFPSAHIENSKEFLSRHAERIDTYPEIRRFRETYKRFQVRIVDQHFLSGKKIRLFMDSDLLWFREPKELTDSIESGVPKPLMMSNSDYIRMEFRDGSQSDDETSRPNGGLVLYREDQFDMRRCVDFLNKSDYVGKRFGDQAWMATILRPALLPEDTYIIKGTLTERVVMRHYTAPQRAKFFFYGLNFIWKDVLKKNVRD